MNESYIIFLNKKKLYNIKKSPESAFCRIKMSLKTNFDNLNFKISQGKKK
jgi:hypothetical protein